MTRSKEIGTRTETAFKKLLRSSGFPLADRTPLKGKLDEGDVGLGDGTGGVIFQVKGGHAAEEAGDKKIAQWIEATQGQQDNAHAEHGVLIVKRKGYGEARAGKWWAIVRGPVVPGGPWVTQRYLVEEYLLVLRHLGYGEPL